MFHPLLVYIKLKLLNIESKHNWLFLEKNN